MPEALIPADPGSFGAVAAIVLALALAVAARRPDLAIRHPRTVLALLALVTLGALASIVRLGPPGLRLELDPSTELLLPRGDPETAVYERAVRDYGDDQVFVVAMETDDVFTRENLLTLRRVSDAISRLDGVRSVRSLVKVTSFRWVEAEQWIEVRPFIEEVPASEVRLRDLRERARRDPLYRGTLVSEDARAAALDVTFRDMTDREFIARDLDGAIRAIVDAEQTPDRRFHLSGRPHIKSRMYHGMIRDLLLLVPVALCLLAAVLGLVGGSARGVVLPLANVTVAVVWTFAAIVWTGRPLTVLSVLIAPTLVAIGSVYGVHVIGRYEEEAAQGRDAAEASAAALRPLVLPIVIAGLTTAVGFAALLWTDVPAVFEVGAFSVFGVASVTLLTLTGVPAALALWRQPAGVSAPEDRPLGRLIDRGLAWLAALAVRRTGVVIAVFAVLGVAAGALVPRVEIDTDYLSFFHADAPVRREFERINTLLSGVVPLFVVLEGSAPARLRDPATLGMIEEIQRGIDALPGVGRTLSFLDTMRVLNRALAGDDPREERIPDTRGAITELFFLLPKRDLQRFVTVDQSSANLVVRTGTVGSSALRALRARIEGVLLGAVPEGLVAHVTGNAILLTRAADGVARSQPRTVGLAALSIFTLLALGLRSARIGAVAMIPNVLPVLLFFGGLGAGLAPLSLPTSLIGSVALGIAIDATAHYLVRYRDERAAGATPEMAVALCNRHVGRPIAISSAMLIVGFGSVTFSEFATLREFGLLTALTMAICAACDLLLLPALLVRWRL